MSVANQKFHRNIRGGLRSTLETLVKATVGPLTNTSFTKSTATSGFFTRAAGSFIGDNLAGGDEFVLSGASLPANNGTWLVTSLSDTELDVVLPEGDTRAIATAGAGDSLVFTAGLPRGQKQEGWAYQPVPAEPWFRESYKAGPELRRNIGSPAYIRLDFLWIVSVFYPSGLGADGPDSMADALRALFYPGLSISYNSQSITILASSRQGMVEEPEWNSVPVSVRGFAHVTT